VYKNQRRTSQPVEFLHKELEDLWPLISQNKSDQPSTSGREWSKNSPKERVSIIEKRYFTKHKMYVLILKVSPLQALGALRVVRG
jgi:hypothetical protein